MSHSISRRAVLAAGATLLAAPAALTSAARARGVEAIAGQLLVLGFNGDSAEAKSATRLAAHLGSGHAGGVVFLRHNIGSGDAVRGLNALFRDAAGGAAPLLCVDQEGGAVQRLKAAQGSAAMPAAGKVAKTTTPEEAKALYAQMAADVARAGFNVNLAPVVDVHDPGNPVIGKHERAFGSDPRTIAAYASAFVEAHRAKGVLSTLKHFPGHGRSRGDSHDGFVDITTVWGADELEPFRILIRNGDADIVMGGHLIHEKLWGDEPVTFSAAALEKTLRGELGFRGAIMTDDLDMGAIRKAAGNKEAVLKSLAAGNDVLLLSNSAKPDLDLAPKAVAWIGEAVADGRLSAARIEAAYARVAALKGRVSSRG